MHSFCFVEDNKPSQRHFLLVPDPPCKCLMPFWFYDFGCLPHPYGTKVSYQFRINLISNSDNFRRGMEKEVQAWTPRFWGWGSLLRWRDWPVLKLGGSALAWTGRCHPLCFVLHGFAAVYLTPAACAVFHPGPAWDGQGWEKWQLELHALGSISKS